LLQAIRYGNQPEVKARLNRIIDAKVGEGLPAMVREHALSSEVLSTADLEQIRADMLEAEARKLQPGYVQAWFALAFSQLGGRMSEREASRFEVTFVPAEIRNRDRLIGAGIPVLPKYQRVTFEKTLVHVEGKPLAELVAPGHPLLEAALDITLERHRTLLRQGAVLIDSTDGGSDTRVLVFLEHAVTDARDDGHGNRRTVSRRFEFVEVPVTGELRPASHAPYLDLRPPTDAELLALGPLVTRMSWLHDDVESRALDYGIDVLSAEHLAEVRSRIVARVGKVKAAVQDRLTRQITYWDHRASELQLQFDAGKSPRMNPDRAAGRADELQRRKEARLAELDREAQVASQPPVVVGAALVIPIGLVSQVMGDLRAASATYTVDTTIVERRAVDAVLSIEKQFGHDALEMPHNHPGYDVRSTTAEGATSFLEVKGRIEGSDTFVVTQNELRFAANVPGAYVLALVEVSSNGPEHDRVRYLQRPYGPDVHLPFDTTSTTLAWQAYWHRATPPLDA
jgi:hypothetical protein